MGAGTIEAVGVIEFGGPEALGWVSISEPSPGRGELRLEVRSASVNPADALLRRGALADRDPGVPPPYVPGMEVSGVVDAVGHEAETTLQVGDSAMAVVVPRGAHGGYSQKVVVPAASAARLPERATFAEAATLPMNGLTVRRALDVLGLRRGQVLAVTGAAGIVGGYAVQLGKAEGLTVVADAAPGDVSVVEQLGADHVVARGPKFAVSVRAAIPSGVDGLIDAGLVGPGAIGAVADGGRIIALRRSTLPGGAEFRAPRGIAASLVSVRDYALERGKLAGLGAMVDDGRLSLRVAEVLPAGRSAVAHRKMEAGGTRGRLVLAF